MEVLALQAIDQHLAKFEFVLIRKELSAFLCAFVDAIRGTEEGSFYLHSNVAGRFHTFCAALALFIERDLNTFRRHINLLSSAKASVHLTTEEVVDIAKSVATIELHESPKKLSTFILCASVLSFSGTRIPLDHLQDFCFQAGAKHLSIPFVDSKSALFYKCLCSDLLRCFRYRTAPLNSPHDVLSVQYFVVGAWEYCPNVWPVVVDCHRIVELSWVRYLPGAVTVPYDARTVCSVFDAYSQSNVILVLTGVPGDVPCSLLERLSGGGRQRCAVGFRMLLTASEDQTTSPMWADPSCFVTFAMPRLVQDERMLSSLIVDETYRLAWPQKALAIEEIYGEWCNAKVVAEEAERELYKVAVDPTDKAASLTAAARDQWLAAKARLETISATFLARASERSEYRIVGEVSCKIYNVWHSSMFRRRQWSPDSTLEQERNGATLPLFAFMHRFVVPSVVQHLTEGSRHFTRAKTDALQAIVDWAGHLSERELLDAHQPKALESHSAVSIALHVLKTFVVGKPKSDHSYPFMPQEQRRRIAALWDAGNRNVVSAPMVDFALSCLPSSTCDVQSTSESDIFARLQRLLLTLSSLKTLLTMDTYCDSLPTFMEWIGHVDMTWSRFCSVEEDVMDSLVRGCMCLSDAGKAATLVDPMSLKAILWEVLSCFQSSVDALVLDVPRKKASALGQMLQTFNQECCAIEAEAKELVTKVVSSNGAVNPNAVLEVRTRVQELREAKRALLKSDPTGRGGSGLPLMRSVDEIVGLCLPA